MAIIRRLVVVAIISFMFSSLAFAAGEVIHEDLPDISGGYIGLHGGLVDPGRIYSNTWDFGPDMGAQIGYRGRDFRFDVTYTYLRNPLDVNKAVEMRMSAVLANGYYDFNFAGGGLAPFVGIGMGWIRTWFTRSNIDEPSPQPNELGYQMLMGLKYDINYHLTFALSFHFLSWMDGSGHQDLVEISLRYNF